MCTTCLQMTVNTGVRYFFSLQNYCYNDLQNLARLTYLGYITQRPAEAVRMVYESRDYSTKETSGEKAFCSSVLEAGSCFHSTSVPGWVAAAVSVMVAFLRGLKRERSNCATPGHTL